MVPILKMVDSNDQNVFQTHRQSCLTKEDCHNTLRAFRYVTDKYKIHCMSSTWYMEVYYCITHMVGKEWASLPRRVQVPYIQDP